MSLVLSTTSSQYLSFVVVFFVAIRLRVSKSKSDKKLMGFLGYSNKRSIFLKHRMYIEMRCKHIHRIHSSLSTLCVGHRERIYLLAYDIFIDISFYFFTLLTLEKLKGSDKRKTYLLDITRRSSVSCLIVDVIQLFPFEGVS